MPLKNGITVGDAREKVSAFLTRTGCYDICANCPIYGEDGCCDGCDHLVRGKGCSQPNLSCLSYTCGALNMHLSRQGHRYHGDRLQALTEMIYGLPREGYRGCERKADDEALVIGDPLEIRAVAQAPDKDPEEIEAIFRAARSDSGDVEFSGRKASE